MKISGPRNIFDLFYLDILVNSMKNILFLNYGEVCRNLTFLRNAGRLLLHPVRHHRPEPAGHQAARSGGAGGAPLLLQR